MLSSKRTKPQTQNGFTLIELLIVIVIISILSGLVLAVVNSTGLRAKTRDSQRVADLKKVQTALELHYAQHRAYPISGTWIRLTGSDSVSNALAPDFINVMPTDPAGGVGASACATNPEDYRYNYATTASGSEYALTAIMEVETSAQNDACDTLDNWASIGCGTPATNCYGVENP